MKLIIIISGSLITIVLVILAIVFRKPRKGYYQMVNKALTLNYNYTQLSEDIQHPIIILTQQAKMFERQALENIVGFGKVLIQVQDLISHGDFGNWLKEEFSLSHQTAYNFINIAKRFGEEIEVIKALPISLTALYKLSEPNIPNVIVEHALEKAKSGKRVKVSEIQELKNQLKEKVAENSLFEDEIRELIEEQKDFQTKIDTLETSVESLEANSNVVEIIDDEPQIVKKPEIVEKIETAEARLKELC